MLESLRYVGSVKEFQNDGGKKKSSEMINEV